MSKAILISIRPEWCEKIASGQKTIEVRKTRPKIETPFKVYIYQTLPKSGDWNNRDGRVIGEFVCDRIDAYESEFWDDDSLFNAVWRIEPDEDDEDISYSNEVMSNEGDSKRAFEKAICMSLNSLKSYIGTDKPNKRFYGWHISDLVIYDKPRELSSFIKPGAMTQEELDDDLCMYCELGDKRHDYSCEKASCSEAYKDYLLHEKYIIERPPQSWCYVDGICSYK